MIYVSWTITVNPERRSEVIAELEKMTMALRSDKGCITTSFYADLWDPNTFRLYEEFESVEALVAVVETPHMQAWFPVKQKLVETGAMVLNNDGGVYEAMPVDWRAVQTDIQSSS